MEEPEKTNQHAFNVDEGTTGKDHTLEELEIGVFRLDREGIRKVLGDLTAAGVETDEEQVREALRNKEIDARRQIIESTNL